MKIGSWAWDATVTLNTIVHKTRNILHLPHWSLSAYLKKRVKSAMSYIENFEKMAIEYARHKGYDGIICGHNHNPCIKTIDGIIYINCGDWVEHCSAIVEHLDGKFELIFIPRIPL